MAVRFDADGEAFIRSGGLGLTGDTLPLTVCGWFKRVADRNTFTNPLNIDDAAGGDGEQITSEAGGDIAQLADNNGSGIVNGPTYVNDTWFFMAGTVEAAENGRIFRWKADGAGALSTGTPTTPIAGRHDSLTRISIGDGPFSNEWFDGSICCVRLWNVVLSESELLDEANSATPVRTSGLVAAWRLETTSDTTDVSGNSRDLTGGTGATTDAAEPSDIAGGVAAEYGVDATVYAALVYDRALSPAEVADFGVATGENTPPTVNAGADRTTFSGANVTIGGSASDAQTPASQLTYAWTVQDAGGTGLTTGDLIDADTPTVRFTAPAVVAPAGVTLRLTVTDPGALSGFDDVTVTVDPAPDIVFPDGMLDYTIHFYLAGGWVDLTDIAGESYVDADTPVTIVRGLQDWASELEAGTATFVLLDDDPPSGRWSPHNPMAPWYGDLGLNTPVRIKVTRATGEYWRFAGEISSLGPPEWDPAGVRVMYPVEANGIFRRIGKWDDPIRSVLRREISRVFGSELRAYWHLEDPEHRRRPAPGLDTHLPMGIRSLVRPDFASYNGFDASAAILTLRDADLNGKVPRYSYVSGDSVWQIGFLLHVGDSGSTGGQTILHVNTSERAAQWEINYLEANGGSLRLRIRDDNGTEILLTDALRTQVNGKDLHVGLRARRSGTNINWQLHTLTAGGVPEARTGSLGGTYSLGRATDIRVNQGGGHDDVAIGHIYVLSQPRDFLLLTDLLAAYEHETAGRRIQRLCKEYGIGFRWPGWPNEAVLDDTERMGPQLVGQFLDLLRECEGADGGRLYEPVEMVDDAPAIGYIPRALLWSQAPAVTFDYEAEQLSEPLPATPDDQGRVNLVTASGPRGEETVELRDGRFSTRRPPAGIGEYPGAIDANLPEGRLKNAAHHHMVRGTTSEARYPRVRVELRHLADDAVLTDAILSADVGDRLVIDNMPVWTSPEQVSQLVEGISGEELTPFEHTIEWSCSPESPYHGGVFDDAGSRFDADSVLAEDLTTTETGVDITTVGTAWTTDVAGEGQWDWIIGGERMTVTAMTAPVWTDSTAAQTATVIRSINGIVKTHQAGAAVSLADPVLFT